MNGKQIWEMDEDEFSEYGAQLLIRGEINRLIDVRFRGGFDTFKDQFNGVSYSAQIKLAKRYIDMVTGKTEWIVPKRRRRHEANDGPQKLSERIGGDEQSEREANPFGIWISSLSYGSGKSHLAYSILKEIIPHKKCWAITSSDFIGKIQNTYNHDHRVTKDEIIDQVIGAGFVFIDDFGKEPPIGDTLGTYYRIINARYVSMRPMMFTSNFRLFTERDGDPSGIEERLLSMRDERAGAIASRLRDMCIEIKFPEKEQRGF